MMGDFEKAMQCAYQIPGMLWPKEQGWLYRKFSRSRSHAEIGVYAGRSLFATSAGFERRCEITAVDNFSESKLGGEWVRSVCESTIDRIHALTHAVVTLEVDSSLEVARRLATEGVQFDSVFIDGNHNYAECKADIEIWSSLVISGGIVSGHDYWPTHTGVMDAVNETGPFEAVRDTRIWYRTV